MVLKTSSARLILNMINDDPDDDMPNQIVKAFLVIEQEMKEVVVRCD